MTSGLPSAFQKRFASNFETDFICDAEIRRLLKHVQESGKKGRKTEGKSPKHRAFATVIRQSNQIATRFICASYERERTLSIPFLKKKKAASALSNDLTHGGEKRASQWRGREQIFPECRSQTCDTVQAATAACGGLALTGCQSGATMKQATERTFSTDIPIVPSPSSTTAPDWRSAKVGV